MPAFRFGLWAVVTVSVAAFLLIWNNAHATSIILNALENLNPDAEKFPSINPTMIFTPTGPIEVRAPTYGPLGPTPEATPFPISAPYPTPLATRPIGGGTPWSMGPH